MGMSSAAQHLLEQALAPDPRDRAELAMGLLDSFGPPGVWEEPLMPICLFLQGQTLEASALLDTVKVEGDPWQLGGAFVITPAGETLYEQVSREAGEHAPLPELLAALRRAGQD